MLQDFKVLLNYTYFFSISVYIYYKYVDNYKKI